MTPKRFYASIIFIFSILLSFAACGCGYVPPADKSVKVTVVESDEFTLEQDSRVLKTDEKGTAGFTVKTEPPYFVKGVDYKNARLKNLGGGRTEIILSEVKYPVRVRVVCGQAAQAVTYDFNGGISADGADRFTELQELKGHLRANAYRCEGITRDGYVFIGWNTEKDGSGRYVSAGSRIQSDKKLVKLYAQWAPQSPEQNFTYEVWRGEAAVTGYAGGGGSIVVPRFLGGVPVTEIKNGAFRNCGEDTLILPDTLKRVDSGAFQSCRFEKLYLFDSVEQIADDSFFNCRRLTSLFINAASAPRYMTYDRHSVMTDKYDILIENRDAKKIVVFGGSGAYFSVDTSRIEAAFPEFKAINMAVNAYYNTQAQFDMIMPYIGEGDVFIHLPEAASEYQFLQRADVEDSRFFMSLESNYGLLPAVDLKMITGVFDSFNEFNADRKDLEEQSYEDFINYIDERGNYNRPKPPYGKNEPISDEAEIRTDFLHNSQAVSELNAYYDMIEAKGAKVFTGNAAVNLHALMRKYDDVYERAAKYDAAFSAAFGERSFLPLSECLYDGADFFNSDYHLCDTAAAAHTDKIIERLRTLL